MKRAILSAATPEAAAAVAANAGATVEEQAKIKEQHRRILRQRNRLMLLRHAARCTIPAGSCPTTNCVIVEKMIPNRSANVEEVPACTGPPTCTK